VPQRSSADASECKNTLPVVYIFFYVIVGRKIMLCVWAPCNDIMVNPALVLCMFNCDEFAMIRALYVLLEMTASPVLKSVPKLVKVMQGVVQFMAIPLNVLVFEPVFSNVSHSFVRPL
jgi:hypothetical protein